ncbi:MAG: TetR/AcrR family transcriptional regulator [Acidimicrobiia bacterium]
MPAKAPRSTGQTQAERRRKSEEALLDAAATLIAERGVEQTSLARIGEAAGTSRGLPTHHFGSKDALVARLARRSQDRVLAATLNVLERGDRSPESLSALDLLRTTVSTYLELFESPTAEERSLIVMWGATFPSQASIDGMTEAHQRGYEGWEDLIGRGKQDGSVRSDVDPRTATIALFGLMRGVAALLLTESEVHDFSGVRATCDSWILAALGHPAANGSQPPT